MGPWKPDPGEDHGASRWSAGKRPAGDRSSGAGGITSVHTIGGTMNSVCHRMQSHLPSFLGNPWEPRGFIWKRHQGFGTSLGFKSKSSSETY